MRFIGSKRAFTVFPRRGSISKPRVVAKRRTLGVQRGFPPFFYSEGVESPDSRIRESSHSGPLFANDCGMGGSKRCISFGEGISICCIRHCPRVRRFATTLGFDIDPLRGKETNAESVRRQAYKKHSSIPLFPCGERGGRRGTIFPPTPQFIFQDVGLPCKLSCGIPVIFPKLSVLSGQGRKAIKLNVDGLDGLAPLCEQGRKAIT